MPIKIIRTCDECGRTCPRSIRILTKQGYRSGYIEIEVNTSSSIGLVLCEVCIKKRVRSWLAEEDKKDQEAKEAQSE